jgi:hypothetical protein
MAIKKVGTAWEGNNSVSSTRADLLLDCGISIQPTDGVTITHVLELGTLSGISTDANSTLTATKKIPIKDDAGNTIYIQAGTLS